MKISAMFTVAFTTVLLIVLNALAFTKVGFSWIFGLSLFGQAMVCVMVYKVLRDVYTTDKTFEDLYEDHPIGRDNYR